uniref:Uncharacterized protein n=1 Tax=Panagrolaimus superbus TaxID=310955 RepID=A0A914YB69_9BILA
MTEFYTPKQACRFPVLNPFDPSILKFIQHPPPLKCSRLQPELTYAKKNKVYLEETLAFKHELTKLQYQYFRRANGSDSSIFYNPWKSFPSSGELSLSHWSGVVLKGTYNKTFSYSNIYASIEPLYDRSKDKEDVQAEGYRPNVVIIGIDSVSRSNVIRNLPLTYKYLTQEIGGWDMRGYVKIDDNTFPNMVAVLTGHKATVQKSEFKLKPQFEFVDEWPFIWKNLSNIGYTTMLAEEQPGIFSYKAPGFKKQPTDVYLRSYESIERFMENQNSLNKPYFVFSFLWKLSHDITYEIEKLDEILVTWLEKIHKKELLKNTLLFITSDHGNRFDKIRSTLIGRYEERMPFLFMRPPEEMLNRFPTIENALTTNLYRMSCHYDFYETLIDIVKGEYGNVKRPRFKDRGYSLFSEIPSTRTCKDVQIEEHFCVCQEETSLSINDPLVQRSAKAILEQINESLNPVNERCLSVQNNNRYHYAQLLTDKNVTNIISFVRVTLQTTPNNGVFEGVVQVTQASSTNSKIIAAITGYDNISRINTYGKAANCISLTHRYLEKFCTCREAGF